MSGSGKYQYGDGDITLGAGRATVELAVTNTGDRAVQVGSHYHFFEANRELRFDRPAAYGRHLAIGAGLAVRFEPGQTRTVRLVDYAGERVCHGFSGLVDGRLDARWGACAAAGSSATARTWPMTTTTRPGRPRTVFPSPRARRPCSRARPTPTSTDPRSGTD